MNTLIHKYFTRVSVVHKSANFTTDNFEGILRHIVVRSQSSGTIYNFTLVDNELNFAIYQRGSVTQEINDEVAIPLKGEYKIYIDSATNDETFRIYMAVEEV